MHELSAAVPESSPLDSFDHFVVTEAGIKVFNGILENSVRIDELVALIDVLCKLQGAEYGIGVGCDDALEFRFDC
ncbi:MAG: hypothetical protein EHM41_09935 [Chloroflexi bacterium]|nr:MAG: hypothetical protein EHM41_09935 [Chloroflexota bacterium]